MATQEQIEAWIARNQDKAGSTDFVTMTEELNKMKGVPTAANRGARAPEFVPAAAPAAPADADSNPYGFSSTTGRIATSAVTSIPDTAIAITNAGVRAAGPEGGGFGMAGVAGPNDPELPSWWPDILRPRPAQQAPYIGPAVNKTLGIDELPPEASTTRRLLEGGASALLSGGGTAMARAGAGGVLPVLNKFGTTVVAPTVASHYGGQAGAELAKAFKFDPETGALIGSLLGGVGPGVLANAPGAITDWKYRGMGRPGAMDTLLAARRQGVQPIASMLGNDTIRARENSYANRFGAADFTNARRDQARSDVGEAWDRMAEARGAVEPQPTEASIGYNVARAAREGAEAADTRSSAGQADLMQRVGPTAPADISDVLAAMRRVARSTDPLTAQPVNTRVNSLESMLPRDPETGDIISYDVDYQRLKDARTGLRVAGEGYQDVPGHHAAGVYDAMTASMRDAAMDQGVPADFFNTVQERTARLTGEGGPVQQLTPVGEAQPTTAYSYLNEGVQNPNRLRMLQNAENTSITPATPPGTNPLMNKIFGEYLRKLGNDTINSPNQGAPGPRQLATRVENMPQESRDVIGGAQQPDMMDIADLARALNMPTRSNGLGRTVGPLTQGVPGTLTAGEVGSAVGGATTIPGGATIGRVLGYMLGPARRAIGGRMMQSDTALNAMAGGPARNNYNMSDLIAAITAANAQQSQTAAPVPPR